MSFEDFIKNNALPEDWNNLEECVKDSLLTGNALKYFKSYMHQYGIDLLSEFWDSKSDMCPLECEKSDDQVLKFREFIKNKF